MHPFCYSVINWCIINLHYDDDDNCMYNDLRYANEEVHLSLVGDAGQSSTQTLTFRKSKRQSKTYGRHVEAAICALIVIESGRTPA